MFYKCLDSLGAPYISKLILRMLNTIYVGSAQGQNFPHSIWVYASIFYFCGQ